jgi:2'-5' RNA ligase
LDLRCFIAIELPEDLKEGIAGKTMRLRAAEADVKWVSPENLHLTLKFLGNTPEDLLAGVREKLSAVAGRHPAFSFSLSGAGAFPDSGRPRVVWIGVRDPGGIVQLQRDVEGAMAELGFEAERRAYSPHLTLGRVKSPRGRIALQEELARIRDIDFGSVEVRQVSIMRSQLRPTGASYSRLFGAPLGGL